MVYNINMHARLYSCAGERYNGKKSEQNRIEKNRENGTIVRFIASVVCDYRSA